jgi:hypothetical protein
VGALELRPHGWRSQDAPHARLVRLHDGVPPRADRRRVVDTGSDLGSGPDDESAAAIRAARPVSGRETRDPESHPDHRRPRGRDGGPSGSSWRSRSAPGAGQPGRGRLRALAGDLGVPLREEGVRRTPPPHRMPDRGSLIAPVDRIHELGGAESEAGEIVRLSLRGDLAVDTSQPKAEHEEQSTTEVHLRRAAGPVRAGG